MYRGQFTRRARATRVEIMEVIDCPTWCSRTCCAKVQVGENW